MAKEELFGTEPWYLKNRLPANWTRIDLQARDLYLLRILLEQKFLSWPQIRDYFFEGKERYAYLRVWKLRRFALARKIWIGLVKEGIFTATEKARDYFQSQFLNLPAPLPIPDIRTLSHDLLVTDIRFLFEKIGFGSSWVSERVWRMGRSVRLWAPDAVVTIGGDPFALEVECAQKEGRRYEEIFARYQEEPEIVGSLYVTTEDLLEALLLKARNFPRIYFITLTTLFNQKESASFRNSEGKALTVRDNLERNLKEALTHGP